MNHKILIYLLLVLISSTVFSCESKKREQFLSALRNFESFSNANSESVEDKYFVLIPGSGCPACLKKAQDFLIGKKYSEDDFIFILTNYESRKRLVMIYGESIISQKNVLLDVANKFHNGGFYSMYPTVVKFNHGSIEIENVDPNNLYIWSTLEQ